MSAGEAFRKLVSEAACKVLTIQELQDLDDAEMALIYAMPLPQIPIKSEDEAA